MLDVLTPNNMCNIIIRPLVMQEVDVTNEIDVFYSDIQ